MSKPSIHSKSCARKFGGLDTDYIEIHNMMDSSKGHFADNRHRTIFHHSFGIFIMEKMFGIDFGMLQKLKSKFNWTNEEEDAVLGFLKHCRLHGTNIKNSNGKEVSVRDVAEQHILEDFKMRFIPSAQDYLSVMELRPWMNNALGGDTPPSYEKLKQFGHNDDVVNAKID